MLALAPLLVAAASMASELTPVYQFGRRPFSPSGPPVRATDGSLYGVTNSGGRYGYGTIYALRPGPAGCFALEILHDFHGEDGLYPEAPLIQASDGSFYGSAPAAPPASGVLFRIDAGGQFGILHTFAGPDGPVPGPVIDGDDGYIYGTTSGPNTGTRTVFKIDSVGVLTTLYTFPDPQSPGPFSNLVRLGDGTLIGSGAYIFALNPFGEFSIVHTFGQGDGNGQARSLIKASDGNIYGVTESGGVSGHGTIFRLTPEGAEAVVHSFIGAEDGETPRNLIQADDGNFYGATIAGGVYGKGHMFRFTLNGYVASTVADLTGPNGVFPHGVVDGHDGTLYGVTSYGESDFGTVFRVPQAGGIPSVLHSFEGTPSNFGTGGVIAASDGNIYGVTEIGPCGLWGSVYRVDSLGRATVLHCFDADAGIPTGVLAEGPDGGLYGITYFTHSRVYRVSRTGGFTILHTFPDSEMPNGGLTAGPDGRLYGVTQNTAFRVELNGEVSTIHTFTFAEGTGVNGPLALASDGLFYGSTASGSIFRMDSSGTVMKIGNAVGSPPGALIQHSNGHLYGTVAGGGFSPAGSIIRVTTDGTYTPIFHFSGPDGRNPVAPLIEGSDGLLYGTTRGGGTDEAGTVFKINTSGFLTTVESFNGGNGSSPQTGLTRAADGALYGSVNLGATVWGYVYRLATGQAETTTSIASEPNPSPAGVPTVLTAVVSASSATGVVSFAENEVVLGVARVGPGGTATLTLNDLEPGNHTLVARYSGDNLLAGSTSEPLNHDVTTQLWLRGLSPTSGLAAGGDCIELAGGGFVTGATLSMGGSPITAVVGGARRASALSQSLTPGTLNDVLISNPDSSSAFLVDAWFADFLDVEQLDPFHGYVEKVMRAGITAGCGGGNYCRNNSVTRAQMAAFLLKAAHGSDFIPPTATGTMFLDVPADHPFAAWIEQLASEGITGGCGGGNYCPESTVLRKQMAVFLQKSVKGPTFVPQAAIGLFTDVPIADPFSAWIEQLYRDGVTGGCGAGIFCPNNGNTRGQMAVFVAKAFSLP